MTAGELPRVGRESPRGAVRLGRSGPWLAAAYALYAALALFFGLRSDWRPEWDSALYRLLAESLAAGDGYVYLERPFFLRPPGLSWALSLLPATARHDDRLLNLLIALAALAAVALTFFLLRGLHGLAVAAASAGLLATSPLFLAHWNWVVADLPFVALLLSAFLLYERAGRSPDRFWLWCSVGAVALGAATYLRSAGVVALPALLLLGREGGGRLPRWRAAAPILLAALLVLPWWAQARRAAAAAPPPNEQLYLWTYSTALWHLDPGDPDSPFVGASDLLARALDNGRQLLEAVAGATFGSGRAPAAALVALLLVTGAVVSWRAGRSPLDGFSLLYLGVLLVYFTFDGRLLLPLLPALCSWLVLGIEAVVLRVAGSFGRAPRRLRIVALATVVVAIVQIAPLVSGGGLSAERRSGAPAIARWLAENTPPESRIVAGEAPVLSWLSGRRVATYRFARSPGIVRRTGAEFAVIEPGTPAAVVAEIVAAGEPVATIALGEPAGGRAAIVYQLRSSVAD